MGTRSSPLLSIHKYHLEVCCCCCTGCNHKPSRTNPSVSPGLAPPTLFAPTPKPATNLTQKPRTRVYQTTLALTSRRTTYQWPASSYLFSNVAPRGALPFHQTALQALCFSLSLVWHILPFLPTTIAQIGKLNVIMAILSY